MKLDMPSKSGFVSETICVLIFFGLHFAFYSFNLRSPASLMSPLSFAVHLFNISFSLEKGQCHLFLVKRKSLARSCCLVTFALVLFLSTFRVINSVLAEKFTKSLVTETLMSFGFAAIQLIFTCWAQSQSQKSLILKNEKLHEFKGLLKTWSRTVDFSIILICFLMISFAQITFTHFLTLCIVMSLMMLEDFKRWVPNLEFVRYEIYRFFLGLVMGLMLINFVVCYFLGRASVSKGLPLILLLLFFKFKEILHYLKIWSEQEIQNFYEKMGGKRSLKISSYLKEDGGGIGSPRLKSGNDTQLAEVNHEDTKNDKLEKSGDSEKPKSVKSFDSFKIEDSSQNSESPLLTFEKHSFQSSQIPDRLLARSMKPSKRPLTRFSSYFIPKVHLILSENWKDSQMVASSVFQNDRIMRKQIYRFGDLRIQTSITASMSALLKDPLFLFNLSFVTKSRLGFLLIRRNPAFVNFVALSALNLYFVFFSSLPLGFFAFCIFAFLSLTFCASDDLRLTLVSSEMFFLPVLYLLCAVLTFQSACLNDSMLNVLKGVIKPTTYLNQSLLLDMFALLCLWRLHVAFIRKSLSRHWQTSFTNKTLFDFFKALRPSWPLSKYLSPVFGMVALCLITLFTLHHVSIISSRNCLFRLLFILGALYFCCWDRLTLKIILRLLIVTSNTIIGFSMLYCFLRPNIFTLRQERFLGVLFSLPIPRAGITFPALHSYLLSNLFLRMTYFFFTKYAPLLRLFSPSRFIKTHILPNRPYIMDFYFRFQNIALLLAYMYLCLTQPNHLLLFVSLNVCLLLLAVLIFQLIKKNQLSDFSALSTKIFRIFVVSHALCTILEFLVQVSFSASFDRSPTFSFENSLLSFLPVAFRKELVKTVTSFQSQQISENCMYYDVLKNLLIFGVAISNSGLKQLVPKVKGVQSDYQRILIFLYIFYFLLFCVNIHYFVFNSLKTIYFHYVTGLFIFFFFVSINYMLYKFYQIGKRFRLKDVLKQKMQIYRFAFLELNPFRSPSPSALYDPKLAFIFPKTSLITGFNLFKWWRGKAKDKKEGDTPSSELKKCQKQTDHHWENQNLVESGREMGGFGGNGLDQGDVRMRSQSSKSRREGQGTGGDQSRKYPKSPGTNPFQYSTFSQIGTILETETELADEESDESTHSSDDSGLFETKENVKKDSKEEEANFEFTCFGETMAQFETLKSRNKEIKNMSDHRSAWSRPTADNFPSFNPSCKPPQALFSPDYECSPKNENLFFEKTELLSQLYKAKFLSQIRAILMDFFMRFLVFYLGLFVVYFFFKNFFLLLMEKSFDRRRLLTEIFILFLTSFNLHLINTVSNRIELEQSSDNRKYASLVKYLVNLLLEVNQFILQQFAILKRENRIRRRKYMALQKMSAGSSLNQSRKMKPKTSKLAMRVVGQRTGGGEALSRGQVSHLHMQGQVTGSKHLPFESETLKSIQTETERVRSESQPSRRTQQSKEWKYAPYRETTIFPPNVSQENKKLKEFQDQMNDLTIKHLDVFLKLNPDLPKTSEELQRMLGIEKMSHQDKKEFARQLEDFIEEKTMTEEGRNEQQAPDFFEENTSVLETSLGEHQIQQKLDYPHKEFDSHPTELEEKSKKASEPTRPSNISPDSNNKTMQVSQTRLFLDLPIEKKLVVYQMNKHNYFSAVFFYSLYNVLKDSIVNIILLFLLNNVNGLSLVSILVMFGCRFVIKTGFNDMILFLSCIFCARLFTFLFSAKFPDNPLASFFILANKNRSFLACEAFIIGSSIFVLIPTLFLVKIVFDDFRVLSFDSSKPFFKIFKMTKLDHGTASKKSIMRRQTAQPKKSEDLFDLESQNTRIENEDNLWRVKLNEAQKPGLFETDLDKSLVDVDRPFRKKTNSLAIKIPRGTRVEDVLAQNDEMPSTQLRSPFAGIGQSNCVRQNALSPNKDKTESHGHSNSFLKVGDYTRVDFSPSELSFQPHPNWKKMPMQRKVVYLNYNLWRQVSKSWIVWGREQIITKGHYIFPLCLFVLSLIFPAYSVFFKLFILYDLFYKLFLKKNLFKSERTAQWLKIGFVGAQVAVLGYILYSVLYLMIKRRQKIDQMLVNMFVMLNFKIILENCLFARLDSRRVKAFKVTLHEIENVVQRLTDNERFLVSKMCSLVNYDRILFFKKYGDSAHSSLARFLRNNLLVARRAQFKSFKGWLQTQLADLTLKIFSTMRRFSHENFLFLGLSLFEKYQHIIPERRPDVLCLLTDDPDCFRPFFRKLTRLKKMMQKNDPRIVRAFYRSLQKAANLSPSEENDIQQVFRDLKDDIKREELECEMSESKQKNGAEQSKDPNVCFSLQHRNQIHATKEEIERKWRIDERIKINKHKNIKNHDTSNRLDRVIENEQESIPSEIQESGANRIFENDQNAGQAGNRGILNTDVTDLEIRELKTPANNVPQTENLIKQQILKNAQMRSEKNWVFGGSNRTIPISIEQMALKQSQKGNYSECKSNIIKKKTELQRKNLLSKLGGLNLKAHAASLINLSQKTSHFPLHRRAETSLVINGFKYGYLYDPLTLQLTFSFRALLYTVNRFIWAHSELLLEVLILMFSAFTFGMTAFLLFGFFLFFYCLENSKHFKYRLGTGMYFLLIASLLIKPIAIYSPLMACAWGPPESSLDYYLVLFLYLSLSTINRKTNKRFVSDEELFTEATLRTALNGSLESLPWQFSADLHQVSRFVFEDTKKDKIEILDTFQDFLLKFDSVSATMQSLWPRLFTNLKLLNRPRDYVRYRKSFWFRNFSHYNIKAFRSHFWVKLALLMLFLVLNVHYFLINKRKVQNLEEISQSTDSIDSMLVLNSSLAFLCFLLELIFSKYQTTNINSIYKLPPYHSQNSSLKKLPPGSNNDSLNRASGQGNLGKALFHMRRAISKIKVIRILSRPLKKDAGSETLYQKQYELLFLKYLLNALLWCYLCFIRFVWLPSYDEVTFHHSLEQIIQYSEATEMKLLFVSFTLYIYFDLLELTAHRLTRLTSILNIDFKSNLKKIIFKVYMAIPFLLEFKTVILFVCSRTSLDILKWFKIEDIKALLINAQFYVESEKRKRVGEKEKWWMKTIMFISFFVPFFLLVILPFIFFSDLNPLKQSQKVVKAQLDIGVAEASLFSNDRNFIKLVTVDLIQDGENNVSQSETGNPLSSLDGLDLNNHVKEKYGRALSQCTILKTFISSKTVYNYNDLVLRQTVSRSSKVRFKLKITTNFHSYIHFGEVRNGNLEISRFREFVEEPCARSAQGEDPSLYHYFYLGEVSKTFETSDQGMLQPRFLGLPRTKLYLKRNCRNEMKYFGIQTLESQPIVFYLDLNDIGAEYILKNMQQESSSTFLGMYLLILFFVGITLIRKNLLNKADALWTENIPKANRILKIIDFIELRRREYNFKEEEVYYYILLDVFRSTEDIIKKSGTLVEMNYKNYLKQKMRDS